VIQRSRRQVNGPAGVTAPRYPAQLKYRDGGRLASIGRYQILDAQREVFGPWSDLIDQMTVNWHPRLHVLYSDVLILLYAPRAGGVVVRHILFIACLQRKLRIIGNRHDFIATVRIGVIHEDTAPGTSAAEELAATAPSGTRVVKAFNTTFSGTLVEGQVAGQPLDVFIAGDDEEAKESVAQLVRDGGLRAIDVGALERARHLEGLGFLGIMVQQPLGLNFQSAWKLIS
jgi:hypothetical protein